MADQDTTEDTQKIIDDAAAAVETAKAEDDKANADEESKVDADTDKKTDEEPKKTDDPTDDSKTDDDDKAKTDDEESKFKKRFTQIKGETPEEYIANLEEAYRHSSTEGQSKAKEAKEIKQKFDNIATIVANNPEIAKAINEATGEKEPTVTVDPAVEYARREMHKKMTAEYESFVDLHPEFVTDEDVKQAVAKEVDIIGQIHESAGREITLTEALNQAWKNLGYDKAEAVQLKAKENAAKGSPSTPPKKPSVKSELSEEQIAMGKKLGLTVEQLTKYKK